MIVQALMAELHTGFLVTNCVCFVILCPWEEIAGNVVNKMCEILVPQTIRNYQIDNTTQYTIKSVISVYMHMKCHKILLL